MKNSKTKIKIILASGIVIALFIFALNLNNNKSINKQMLQDYTFNVAGIEITATDNVLGELNIPQLGAGMIPIKYNESTQTWQITSTSNENNEWYDYSEGKMATVMLCDGGYFLSEEQQNMNGHVLASNAIGSDISPEQLGTIFVWLPRMVKLGDNDFRFLKDYSIINYEEYKTPDCFSYIKDGMAEYAFKGVWIEQTPKTTLTESNTEIADMKKEANKYGLIKNEIVQNYEGTIVDTCKLYQEKFKKQKSGQKVSNVENTNRAIIRILNTNCYVPLTAKAKSIEKVAHITTYSDFGIYKILYLDKENDRTIDLPVINGSATMSVPDEGTYDFVVIDNAGNIQSITLKTAIGVPDLTGFRIDTTYIVTFKTDAEGNITENSETPIKEILKKGYKIDKNTNTLISGEVDLKRKANVENKIGEDWYNYPDSKWANVVVRNNGSEAYFVWIPRYVYTLNNEEEITNIKFVNTENQDSAGNMYDVSSSTDDTVDWTLPEAFIWWDENGNEVPLQGFWLSKYELSTATTFSLTADAIGGLEKIMVNNIANGTGLVDCTYEYIVYKDGVDKTELDNTELMSEWQVASIKSTDIGKTDYTFLNIPGGTYQVRIILYSKGNYMGEIWKNNIKVDSKGVPNEPDLTGFRLNTTYVVAYNDDEEMDVTIPISEILQSPMDDEEVSQNTVKSGTSVIDNNKVQTLINDNGYVWYDYDESKWANVVVRNGGGESYYTWIPRYIYKLNTNDGINGVAVSDYETTEIMFVQIDPNDNTSLENIQSYLDDGWILPEAFTWQNGDDLIQLNGFWLSKYELSSHTNFDLKVADDSGLIGELNRVRINNISNNLGLNHYRLFLYETDESSNKIADFENANNINTGYYKYYAEGLDTPPTTKDEYGVYICNGKNFVRYEEIESNGGVNQTTFKNLVKGTYALRIVAYDDEWKYRGESWYYDIDVQDMANQNEKVEVDFTGFNKDVTYYVTFDNSANPIRGNNLNGTAPANWYDYNDSRWANILVNGNGKEAYFVWIPRYAYKIDNIREETLILFLKPNDPVPDGWTLPEAFEWKYDEDEDGNAITQKLKGYWLSKYELSAG